MRVFAGLLVCAFAFSQDSATETHLRELERYPNSSLASFRLGEIFVKQNNYQSAANHFHNALRGDRLPAWVVVWSHVNLGRIFENTGQRERAVREYQTAVRTNDNTGGALDEALKFLKETGHPIPEPTPDVKAPSALRVPPGVFPLGPGVTPPVPTDTYPPDYSDEARIAELEGTVLVGAVIGVDGNPREIQIARSLGLGLDEKAVEAVGKWRFRPGSFEGKAVDTFAVIPIEFEMPSKISRWHLIRATFRPPDGASRPVFRSASYPPMGGVSRGLMDHARVIAAAGRQATATLSFEVNPQGRPVRFKVESASDDRWEPEAISIVQTWEFTPGMKDREPVSVPCTVTLVWGQRNLGAETVRQIAESTVR